jgi:hypothetical protein
MGQYTFQEIRSCLASRTVIDRDELAMLHNIELAQPVLVEWIASSMNDMAQPVLFCQNKHRV